MKQWIYKIEFNKEFKEYKKDNRSIHIHNCREFHQIAFRQLKFPEDKQDYKIITIIRDPIKRLISAYSNRVIHYKQLSERVVYRDKIEAANLKFNPDINYFVENLETYQDCAGKWTILHHTRPIIDFLGEDISLYTNIYPIEEINQIKEDILLDANLCLTTDSLPEIPKSQTGGPKLKLDVLEPRSFDKLIDYYAKDYELLGNYYPLKKIKEQYISSIKASNFYLSDPINTLDRFNKNKQEIEIDNFKQYFSAYKSLGDTLAKQKKIKEAIAAYQKAIELDSENSTIYRGIGYCYHEAHNYPEAIKNYKKAIALEAKQPYWVYLNLANALVNQKQLNEAILNYEKAIALEAENSSLYVNLGNLYLQQGNSDEAFDCYLKAVRLEPGNGISYGKLGYFHNGHVSLSSSQLDKAIECYQQAIDKQPNFFLPYVYLGDSLTAKNDLARAISYYQMAGEKKLLAKYPELRESQYDLDKVEQPNFIIIGAGKSGTSSLYEYICSHPQVISSLKKELRFFSYKPNFQKGVDWYLSHFSPIPKGKNLITGEATPGYFGWDVQESIYNLFPNIKLITILRNPVDRAFSQYNHWVRNGIERRSFEESVIVEIEKLEKVFDNIDILDFEKIETIEEICLQVRKGNSKEKTGYLWEGLYVYFLQKWTSYFSKEQLLVIQSEDFYARPEIEMKKVFTFLSLPDYQLPQYRKYNAGKYSSIDEQLYSRISEFFQPHTRRLEEYLNRKMDWI